MLRSDIIEYFIQYLRQAYAWCFSVVIKLYKIGKTSEVCGKITFGEVIN